MLIYIILIFPQPKSFCGQTSFISVESSHAKSTLKTPVPNKTINYDDTCASDCLLNTPVTIFISDKDLQGIETPDVKITPVVKNTSDGNLTTYETFNAAELSTQYPLQTSYSSFKESESSGLYSSEEESSCNGYKTRSRLTDLSSFHNKSKNGEKSVVSPLVFYEETLKDSTINKTQQVKGVVDYENTINQLSDQSALHQTQSPASSEKLVPYEKSMATMSEVSLKMSPLVPYDKTSATTFHDDTYTYDETLPSFSETFKNKTPTLVPYDKTSATIIQDSTTPNIVGYDTTLPSLFGDASELTKSSINLVPYENTMLHKTPVSGNKTSITGDDQEHSTIFEAEPSPIVSKEQYNKTTYTTDGSTFDEMSAFENPNATGLMVGNVKNVSILFYLT